MINWLMPGPKYSYKMTATQSQNFPTFSLENHLNLRPYQFLNEVQRIGSARHLSERELITTAQNFCVGYAKTLIDNEPTFAGLTSWRDFCDEFTTFFNKNLTYEKIYEIFENMKQRFEEDVEAFSKRLESIANTLAEMAKNTQHPEASIRVIVKDLVRIFVNGLIVGKDEVMKENPKNLQEAVKKAKIVQMQRYNKSSANPNIGSTFVNNKFAAEELNIIQYDLDNMKLMLNSSVTREMVGGFLNQIQEHLNKLSALRDYISDGQLKNWHSDVKHKAKNLKKYLKSYSILTQTKQLSLDEIWAEINKLDWELHQKPSSRFKDPDVHRKFSDKLQHISNNLSTVTTPNAEENKIYNGASSRIQHLNIYLMNLVKDPSSKDEQRLYEISLTFDRIFTSDKSLISIDEINNEVQSIMRELKSMDLSQQPHIETLRSETLCRAINFEEHLKEIYRRKEKFSEVLGEIRTKIEELEIVPKQPVSDNTSLEDYRHRVNQIEQQLGSFNSFPDKETERLHSELKSRIEVLRQLQISPETDTGKAKKLLLEASTTTKNLRRASKKPSLGDVLGEIETKIEEIELTVLMNSNTTVMDKASYENYRDRVDQISQQLGGFSDFPNEESKRLHSKLNLRVKVLTELLRIKLEKSQKPEISDSEKSLLEASTAMESLKIKITEFTKKGVKSERQYTCLDDELTKVLTVLYAFDISERSSMRMKRKELIVVAQQLAQDLEKSFKGK